MKFTLGAYVKRHTSLRSARSVLTGSAIALGVACVFALTTITAAGTRVTTEDMLAGFGGADMSVALRADARMDSIARRISAFKGVRGVVSEADSRPTKLRLESYAWPVMLFVRGVDTQSASLRSVYKLGAGRFPRSIKEAAVSGQLARALNKQLGDTYQIKLGTKRLSFKVVGLVDDGHAPRGGALFVYVPLAHLKEISDQPEAGRELKVVLDRDIQPKRLKERVAKVNGIETVTLVEEIAEDTARGTALAGAMFSILGGIALFVGSFLIYTTFSITAVQREREYAVLRALGATRRRVRRLVYAEALIMAIIFSIVGLFIGGGLAALLLWVAQITKVIQGIEFSDLAVDASAVLPALAAGIIVTLLSALGPARRAARVMPLVTMRVDQEAKKPGKRWMFGAFLALMGVAAVAYFGAKASNDAAASISAGAFGVLAIFVGTSLAMPGLITPLLRLAAAGLKKGFGVVGWLAALNLRRVPSRSGNTTVMVLIGISLVVFIGALSSSAVAGGERIVDHQVQFDLAITRDGYGPPTGVPSKILGKIRRIPGVRLVTGFTLANPKLVGRQAKPGTGPGPNQITIAAFEPRDLRRVSGLFFRDEKARRWSKNADRKVWDSLAADGVFVASDWAKMQKLQTGDALKLASPKGRAVAFKVTALVDTFLTGGTQMQAGTVYMSRANADKYFPGRWSLGGIADMGSDLEFEPMIKLAPGADAKAVRSEIKRLIKGQPGLLVLTARQVRERVRFLMEGPSAFLYLIFGVAIIIGLLGVVNTVTIGVLERRREIGLLRAVGASRRQMQRLVIGETLLLAMFGAVLGTALGGLVAAVFAKMLAAGQISFPFVFPWSKALVLLAATLASALAAAVYPARLAGRITVTDALRYE